MATGDATTGSGRASVSQSSAIGHQDTTIEGDEDEDEDKETRDEETRRRGDEDEDTSDPLISSTALSRNEANTAYCTPAGEPSRATNRFYFQRWRETGGASPFRPRQQVWLGVRGPPSVRKLAWTPVSVLFVYYSWQRGRCGHCPTGSSVLTQHMIPEHRGIKPPPLSGSSGHLFGSEGQFCRSVELGRETCVDTGLEVWERVGLAEGGTRGGRGRGRGGTRGGRGGDEDEGTQDEQGRGFRQEAEDGFLLEAPGGPWIPPGGPWKPLEAPGFLLEAPGGPWRPLDPPGSPWKPLEAPGFLLEAPRPLEAPGFLLEAPGGPWIPTGGPWMPLDSSWMPLDSSWKPLDAPGFLLKAPGSPWRLLCSSAGFPPAELWDLRCGALGRCGAMMTPGSGPDESQPVFGRSCLSWLLLSLQVLSQMSSNQEELGQLDWLCRSRNQLKRRAGLLCHR
ncbi:unnamed protein product [Pleuronectes platessa]|uniref:Uncharacterized protein n=1 Tax=Pleuronectes platessa TaxID=8262 RepID=A0A9N7TXU2_PLEPL|nr:unnamed protein product [Pleuronectes platessa]